MTPEELLKPRYKVIAEWPPNMEIHNGKVCKLGDIIKPQWKNYKEFILDRYQHLFKKLEWWEDRKESEMPQYLVYKRKIIKIDKWFFVGSDLRFHTESPYLTSGAYGTLPATEEEFNNQKLNKLINGKDT